MGEKESLILEDAEAKDERKGSKAEKTKMYCINHKYIVRDSAWDDAQMVG